MRASALNPAGAASPFPANTGATPSSCVHTSSPACAYVTESWSPFAEGSQIPDVGTRAKTSPPPHHPRVPQRRRRASTPSRNASSPTRGLPERHARHRGDDATSRVARVARVRSIQGPQDVLIVREARGAWQRGERPHSECPTTATRGGGFARVFSSPPRARRPSAAAPLHFGEERPVRRGVPPVHARVAHRLRRLRPPLLARHAVHLALAQQTAHRRRRGAAKHTTIQSGVRSQTPPRG